MYFKSKKPAIPTYVPIYKAVTSNGHVNPSLDTNSDLYLPIALRKGIRTCTQHPISNFVSLKRLLSKYRAFVTHLSSNETPKTIQETLNSKPWKYAMSEELQALEKNKT